jgi:hypothetical protein
MTQALYAHMNNNNKKCQGLQDTSYWRYTKIMRSVYMGMCNGYCKDRDSSCNNTTFAIVIFLSIVGKVLLIWLIGDELLIRQ